MSTSVNDIEEYLKEQGYTFKYSGDDLLKVDSFSALSEPRQNSLIWIRHLDKFNISSLDTDLDLLIVTDNTNEESRKYNVISTRDPRSVYFSILSHFFLTPPSPEVSSTATILTTNIGTDVSIGHHSFIDRGVSIGNRTIIRNGVSIQGDVTIGEDCLIESGVVIGSGGFGFYYSADGCPKKIPDFCGVRIGDRVEIGANAAINRGTLSDTILEDDVKIGELVLVAHNGHVHQRALVVSGTMLGGSADIGEDSYVGLASCVMNQAHVGRNTLIGMGAVVIRNVADAHVVVGNPARTIRRNEPAGP